MRYRKGTIALSDSRDYPLLRRVLHCGFATSTQLYEFMRLDYAAAARNAFDNRLRRLLEHELLVRQEIRSMDRGVVYSISRAGISEMIAKGEYYAGCLNGVAPPGGHVQHALELNDIHLALKRTGILVRWTPESDIRSRNELTDIGYVKDYDATVAVRLDDREHRFALEYERTPKAKRQYQRIWKRIEAEAGLCHFLYLVPNHDLLSLLVRVFRDCSRQVHFGLRSDFLADTLSLSVRNNHSPLSTTFRAVLTARVSSQQGSYRTTTGQPALFAY